MEGNPCSVGALSRVCESDSPASETVPNPILQVLRVKPITGHAGGPTRYRVVLSDTQNYVQSMLVTQANPLAESGDLSQGCFIRLESYQSFTIKNQRILILVGLEILEEYGKPEKIGEPVPLEPVMTQAEQQQPSTATFHGGQPTPVATVQRRVAPRSGPRTARGPP